MTDTAEIMFDYKLPDDELHKTIGGGLPRSSVILIEGDPGMGKSILAQRFMYGLLYNGCTVSYISSELSVQGFLNQTDSLKYDIKEEFLDGRLKFVSLFSKNRTLVDDKNLVQRFFYSQELLESDIIIFDMLNHVLVDESMTYEQCYEVASHFKKHASQGKTVVICAESGSVNTHLFSILNNIADGHIEMGVKEQYGVSINLIKVHRMIGAVSSVDSEVPFKVRSGVGIVVDISS
ncbi:MAG: ATPase domain-containing protein [Nanoarchaeota archaeon]